MTKIFVTGPTGYIGGDALYAVVKAHPEYEITALVRNSDKGAKVAKQYPNVKLVYGDLDSAEILEEESKKADVVLHFASADHAGAATAIAKGLSTHDATSPGFFIHTSGTGNLMFEDIQAKTFGEAFREKVYNDLEGVSEVTSLPDAAPHRNVDKIVLAAGTEHSDRIKTAIVCPPCIYGAGRGPDNQRSVQLPALCKASLEKGSAVQVNAGKTYWGNVHVYDLSALYLLLVEEAAAGGSKAEWPGKPAVWGPEGYYFVENGEQVWGEISQGVGRKAKKLGFLPSDEVKSISPDEASKVGVPGHVLWGANSRSRARRAKEVLKWKPTSGKIEDEIESCLETEARALGLKVGHATVAAGES